MSELYYVEQTETNWVICKMGGDSKCDYGDGKGDEIGWVYKRWSRRKR